VYRPGTENSILIPAKCITVGVIRDPEGNFHSLLGLFLTFSVTFLPFHIPFSFSSPLTDLHSRSPSPSPFLPLCCFSCIHHLTVSFHRCFCIRVSFCLYIFPIMFFLCLSVPFTVSVSVLVPIFSVYLSHSLPHSLPLSVSLVFTFPSL